MNTLGKLHMTVAVSILIGVISSLVASIIFLLAFTQVRPRIAISPVISRTKNLDGEKSFRVKVVNLSRRPALDVRVEFRMRTPRNNPGGTIVKNRYLKVKEPKLFQLNPLTKQIIRKTGFPVYGKRFTVVEDLDAIWDDATSYLTFTVYATDSVSGLGKVFSQDFRSKSEIIDGVFEYGVGMKVVSSQ